MKSFEIFLSALKIAFTSFGGGSSAIPIIHNEYVSVKKWVSNEEFAEMVILANLLPGPTIIQLVALVSRKQGGWTGTLIGVSGVSLPVPIILISLLNTLSQLFPKEILSKITAAVLPVVIFMLIAFIWEYFNKNSKAIGGAQNFTLTAAAFAASYFFKLNIAIMFLAAIAIIISITLVTSKQKGKRCRTR